MCPRARGRPHRPSHASTNTPTHTRHSRPPRGQVPAPAPGDSGRPDRRLAGLARAGRELRQEVGVTAAAAPSGKRSPAAVKKASRGARTARRRSTLRSHSVRPRSPRPTSHPELQSRAPGDSGSRASVQRPAQLLGEGGASRRTTRRWAGQVGRSSEDRLWGGAVDRRGGSNAGRCQVPEFTLCVCVRACV